MDFKERMVLGVFACCIGLWGCEESAEVPADGGTDVSRDGAMDATTDLADMGPACPAGDVMITEDVTEDTTWSCPRYRLFGQIFVTGSSTLTIEPGVEVVGDSTGFQQGVLVVTRGSQLHAVGTAAQPIVFSSGVAAGSRATGDWGGIALLGTARINAGTDNAGTIEGRLEGLPPTEDRGVYGGDDNASSCGHLEYVRIEFAGAEFGLDSARNALTLAGCGSGTEISYVQIHRGFDDGIEIFGGTAGMDHVIISGAGDDGLDWDLGWRGDVQFLVIHQFAGIGDNGIEADNLGSNEAATPRSHPRLFNVTMVGSTRGMVLREGTRGLLRNFIIQDWASEPVDLRATTNDLSMEWPSQLSIENSFFFNNGAYTDETTVAADNDDNGFDEQAAIEDPDRHNRVGADPMLGSTSISAPNYVPANTALNGQATPPASFDTTATYAGAFAPNGTNWASGWTAYPAN
ncbi:MAG: hypothetical protein H6726_02980 [Sandaracinaceae bacterium]|nr:hypothetical protein [Sandaracinaceae bacterium]